MHQATAQTETIETQERPKPIGLLTFDVRRLVEAAAKEYGVSVASILMSDRHKEIAAARHAVWWVMRARWMSAPSFPEIGRALRSPSKPGGYDHTTVMSGVRHIAREIELGTAFGLSALRLAGLHPVATCARGAAPMATCAQTSELQGGI